MPNNDVLLWVDVRIYTLSLCTAIFTHEQLLAISYLLYITCYIASRYVALYYTATMLYTAVLLNCYTAIAFYRVLLLLL